MKTWIRFSFIAISILLTLSLAGCANDEMDRRRLVAMNNLISDIESRLEDLESEVEELKTTVDDLELQVDELNQRIEEIESNIDTF